MIFWIVYGILIILLLTILVVNIVLFSKKERYCACNGPQIDEIMIDDFGNYYKKSKARFPGVF